MKIKYFKRSIVLILTVILSLTFSITAFATALDRHVTVPANSTVEVEMGYTTRKTSTVRISSTDNGTNGTIYWRVYKEGEPAFMSGTTYIGESFSQSGILLYGGTYYIQVTNNSNKSVSVDLHL